MKLIVCLDERNGLSFLGRRQSQDRALRQRMLQRTQGAALWMNAYSAAQFENAETIKVDERFWEQAGDEDYCFAELAPVESFLRQISCLVVYRWNRHYPSDRSFPMEALEGRLKKRSAEDFVGSSHECITEEVYSL
jgi:hypothetical protein